VKRVTQVLEAGFKVRVLTYPGRCLTVALLSALQLGAKFGTGSIAYIVETYEAMPPSYFSLHLQQQVANDTIVRLKDDIGLSTTGMYARKSLLTMGVGTPFYLRESLCRREEEVSAPRISFF